MRAHLPERLEAPAEDRSRGGAQTVERGGHHRKRRRPRRAVPEPERRLQSVGDADDGRRADGRGVPPLRLRPGLRLDSLADHVRVHALRDERGETSRRLHRDALVRGVERLDHVVARRGERLRARARGVELVQSAHRGAVRAGERDGEGGAPRGLQGGRGGERRDRVGRRARGVGGFRRGGGGGGRRRRGGAEHRAARERGLRRRRGRARGGEEGHEHVARVLREERLVEVEEAGHGLRRRARGGLGDLADDRLQGAEEVQRLRRRGVRLALRGLRAGRAAGPRELMRGVLGRARGLDGDGCERRARGLRGGGAADRAERVRDGRRRLLAHLRARVHAEVADGGERLRAVRPLLEDDRVRGGVPERGHEEADAVHDAAEGVLGLLRRLADRHEDLHRRGHAGQDGRRGGVLEGGAEDGEHRARLFGRGRGVRTLERGHRRREHGGR